MRKQTLRKVWHYVGHYRLFLILSLVLSFLSTVLQLFVPMLFGDAIDAIGRGGTVDFALLSHYLVLIFGDPMDYSPPGSSVHGIFQARVLE